MTAAVACVAAATANAATTSYNDGDLLLGVRMNGSTVDYLVDLGNVSNFDFTKSFTFSTTGIGADLAANFGSDWYTNSNVKWSVIGTVSYDENTGEMNILYTTNPSSTAFTPSGSQSDTTSLILSMGTYFNNKTSTTNNANGVVQTVAASEWTYANSQSVGSHAAGISLATWDSNEATPSNSLSFDLLHEGQITGNALGSIALDNNGTVTFEAVPEPSTYAMVCIGALGMARILRRRKLNA